MTARTPTQAYRALVDAGRLSPDAAQERAIQSLTRLHLSLAGRSPAGPLRKLAHRWLDKPLTPVRGVYLWGGVGRGKTLMMDLFFDCLPFADKERAHFHRFMAGIHTALKRHAERSDPLELVADEIADRARIVCFDEFTVTDIADAMILGNLFTALFRRGISLAATSNLKPEDLYRGGLQRQRFLPAIDAIRTHTEIVEVDGLLDYRLRVLERADVYQCPAGEDADKRLAGYLEAVAPDAIEQAGEIDILDRPISHRGCADGVIWFDFDAVCDGPRSKDDYIELSRLYQTVLVSNIPQFDATLENQARRFIALIDEFYERRVKLIASASVPVDDLYRGNRLTHEFERTRSRLQEMQTVDYLASAHLS